MGGGRGAAVGDLDQPTHTSPSSPSQYYVLRQKGTERPGTGPLNKNYADGEYNCAGCGNLLFTSDMKFDSGCGWPAFWCVE